MNNDAIQKLYTKKASFYDFFFLDFLGVGRRIEKFFRQSDYVRSDFKILDAGCGTGNTTKSLYTLSLEKGYKNVTFHAFDLTQAMLDLFQQWVKKVGANNIILKQADVLGLEQLPPDWNEYDRIVSCGMLEYLPKDKMRKALSNLELLLKNNGRLVVFITSRNIITKLFIEQWWKANTYDEKELQKICLDVGFSEFKITKKWWRMMFTIEAKK
jgi:cyclopropane fatty-acyl-phospholipid synthase-like methyltransferase